MGRNREPHTSDVSGRVEIFDLGADPDSPVGQVPPQQRAARRSAVKVSVAAAVVLLVLAAVQTFQSNDQKVAEAVETLAQKPDVCDEVARANGAEMRISEVSSDRDTGSAPGLGYSLLGAWPEGADDTVIYGRLYPDQSIEICGDPEDLAHLGITSSVRQEELGELPEGASYAYELNSAGPPNQELELLGVRQEDGTIFDVVVLPDGSVRPLTATLQGEAVPSGG